MKYLFALLLLPLAAQAETLTLGSEPCTGAAICSNVPNDAQAAIAYIDWAPRYQELTLNLNGVLYQSGLWSVPSLTNAAVFDHNGNQALVTLTFSTTTTCNRTGRGQACVTHYTLVGGAIVR